jgi:hypothetical protein
MRTTILAYLMAIVGLAMIVAGAWGLLNLLDPTIGIEMMAEGWACGPCASLAPAA